MPGKTLVVVESPAKAKTIARILGDGYEVKASKGHVADLPERTLGVDLEADFAPTYEIKKDKRPVVEALRKAARGAERVILATDPDREGEAISWHVARLLDLDPSAPVRVHFHEITPRVVREAIAHPAPINQNLVDAQQARRVLDRLVGYNLSPLLSEKFRQRALSAGRVQSVALRLIVEREEEIEAFEPQEYWTVSGAFTAGAPFTAELYSIDGQRVVDKNRSRFLLTSEAETARILEAIRRVPEWRVAEVARKTRRKSPPPPFTTSTLQQAASSRLGWTASRTMRVAQRLYEGVDLPEGTVGLITYMRTDSVRVAPEALEAVRRFIPEAFGPAYLPQTPNRFKSKKSGVQDAHEAIRPTAVERTPERVKPHLSEEEYRLYTLIWQRFVASQMSPAVYDQTVVTVEGGAYRFRATGSVLRFDGYLRAWGREEDEAEQLLPEIPEGAPAQLTDLTPAQHFTQPPPRYNDASLVKTMEELGIGRPSTYAPTIETLERRRYIERQGRALRPTPLGREVVAFLKAHFPRVVAYEFTAEMENRLDAVEEGKVPWPKVVREFFEPFTKELEKVPRKTCPLCGRPLELKVSRYGQFLGCTGYPECRYTEPLEKREAEPLGEPCPECGRELVRKHGRYGTFIACSGYPECTYTRDEAPSTGLTCPKCREGEVVVKTSRKGKPYYRCNRKACDFLSFYPLVEERCDTCGWNLMEKGRAKTRVCSNPACPRYGGPDLSKPRPSRKSRATRRAAKPKPAPAPKATWTDLEPFLSRLAEDEARLARLVEGEGRSLKDAAQALGLTEEAAAALYKRAIFKLRMAYGRARKAGEGSVPEEVT
ncbi:type I DNA topoisomerase [Marinithermus hydrothermalis]|uniref:DNA topoisomerase 1 n=1 Tax=Marinithermus hydrothermalis (strain DSM 14884 / JCM 11576 / T1) TaxID=869210 RepID=F2NLP3_MARHT|nr:type I DNA topoisomerase [Marinithermus hydrothermalis]AEB10873.1 DNA topoisomerase I [Marinithermus hydrothermalis DSM 14884]